MQEKKDNNNVEVNNIKEENKEEVKTQTIDKEENEIKEEVISNQDKSGEKVNNLEKVNETKFDKEDNKLHDKKNSENKITFASLLKKGIFDTLGIMFISVGGLAVLGLIFKYILGYYIIDPWGMLFIVFLIASVFYPYINYVYKKRKKKD